MTDGPHKITGCVEFKMELTGPDESSWESRGLIEDGPWTCSCGEEFSNSLEASEHYRETH